MQKSRSPAARSGALPGARPHGRCPIRVARPPQSGFDRRLALSRLLALWPHELDDESPPARRRILGRLRKALRAERRRGLAGHWTYDLARHIELLGWMADSMRSMRLSICSSMRSTLAKSEIRLP